MLASPGHSPRHVPPSPSPSNASERSDVEKAHASGSVKAIMGPPPPRKPKRKPTVLDEDTYVAAIERIVERDFFPDLPKLQDRLKWLEAVRSGDPTLIREAQMQILKRRTDKARGSTPSIAGTPFTAPGGASPAGSLLSVDVRPSETGGAALATDANQNLVDCSLDEFLQRYTSEDNDSFGKIIEKVNKKRKQKAAYLSEKVLLAPMIEQGDRSTDGFGSTGQAKSTLESWNYRSKNLLMYDAADRPDAPFSEQELLDRVAGPPKEVNNSNTRFHAKVFQGAQEQEQEVVAVIYGTPGHGTPAPAGVFGHRILDNARHYDLVDMRKTPQGGAVPEGEYPYVATPSPRPGVDESPFMTWGDIEGTPLRLEAEDTPVGIGGSADGVHFRIPAPPARDAAAHTMSRMAAKNIQERRQRLMSPSPSPLRSAADPSPSLGGSSLSTVAQRLISKAMAKRSQGVDTRLRESYRGSATPRTPGSGSRGGTTLRDSSLPLQSPSPSPLPSQKHP